ncbi:hypothetical protein WR25_16056 [Diploscapter pachys]|uniref:C2H2-type domain-containing protein n=1 Tax=Diploscapter pachys TaxID=2018661 RepID=A0A2A2KIX9_9BILA|nr:hypothetical protein WR25_16056 [Diploscapter pachys]
MNMYDLSAAASEQNSAGSGSDFGDDLYDEERSLTPELTVTAEISGTGEIIKVEPIDEFEGQRPKSQEEQIEGPLGALFVRIDANQQPGPSRATAYSPVDGLKEESESYNPISTVSAILSASLPGTSKIAYRTSRILTNDMQIKQQLPVELTEQFIPRKASTSSSTLIPFLKSFAKEAQSDVMRFMLQESPIPKTLCCQRCGIFVTNGAAASTHAYMHLAKDFKLCRYLCSYPKCSYAEFRHAYMMEHQHTVHKMYDLQKIDDQTEKITRKYRQVFYEIFKEGAVEVEAFKTITEYFVAKKTVEILRRYKKMPGFFDQPVSRFKDIGVPIKLSSALVRQHNELLLRAYKPRSETHKEMLKDHCREDGAMKCLKCGIFAKTDKERIDHICYHLQKERNLYHFRCRYCLSKAVKYELMQDHHRDCHSDKMTNCAIDSFAHENYTLALRMVSLCFLSPELLAMWKHHLKHPNLNSGDGKREYTDGAKCTICAKRPLSEPTEVPPNLGLKMPSEPGILEQVLQNLVDDEPTTSTSSATATATPIIQRSSHSRMFEFTCRKCGTIVLDKNAADLHVKEHLSKDGVTKTARYKCKLCPYRTTKYKHVEHHFVLKHPKRKAEAINLQAAQVRQEQMFDACFGGQFPNVPRPAEVVEGQANYDQSNVPVVTPCNALGLPTPPGYRILLVYDPPGMRRAPFFQNQNQQNQGQQQQQPYQHMTAPPTTSRMTSQVNF